MKIGLSATMVQGGRSGVAQYVFAVVRELMATPDAELSVFVLEKEASLFEFARNACDVVVVPDAVGAPLRNVIWHQWELPRLVKRMKLDVLHIPSYRRLVGHAPCPTVGTIHDLAPFHVAAKYDAARMFYGRVVVKQLARRQDQLVAVSHDTAKDIHRFFGIPRDEIEVIHNGIDHSRFKPMAADPAVAASRGLHRPYFLYVSRLEHPAKNHVRLIEAFARFKQESGSDMLLALGGGDWHGSEAIYEAAKNSPVADDIRFLGFVPDEELADLYRSALAMIYPSLFEGFGLPPAEAMACATPVISSTRGALQEVVADAALTIDPENVAEMTAAMKQVAQDEGLRQSLRERGLVNAARFNWSTTASKLMDVYRRVCR